MGRYGEPPMRPRHDNSLWAILVIAIGALFLLQNIGIFTFARIGDFWPMWIAAWAAIQLTRCRDPRGQIWPLTMIVVCVLLTLGNLGILNVNFGQLWPLFVIAAGIGMLMNRGRTRRDWRVSTGNDPAGRHSWTLNMTAASDEDSRFEGNYLRENVVFSGVSRRIDTATFEGGDLNTTFGELKVDLRGAAISTPDRQAFIETNATFGAIKIRIPETWRAVLQGNAVFGSYEDKTLPPKPVAGVDTPTLVVRGNATFGEVKIEN